MFQASSKVKCHIYLSLKKKILSVGEINPLKTAGTQETGKKIALGKQQS